VQTLYHYFNIYTSSCIALALDAKMDTANSLHASAYYGEYNKIFGFGK